MERQQEKMVSELKQEEKLCELRELVRREIKGEGDSRAALEDALWDVLVLLEGKNFETAKHLNYSYSIKGYEIFVSRKDKSITRSTVNLSLWNAMELQKAGLPVSGPKKLKTQTSHNKNGSRTLKNQYFSPQNTLMRLPLSVPMHPAYTLEDVLQSWL